MTAAATLLITCHAFTRALSLRDIARIFEPWVEGPRCDSVLTVVCFAQGIHNFRELEKIWISFQIWSSHEWFLWGEKHKWFLWGENCSVIESVFVVSLIEPLIARILPCVNEVCSREMGEEFIVMWMINLAVTLIMIMILIRWLMWSS